MILFAAGLAYKGGRIGIRKARAIRKCRGKKGKQKRKCIVRAMRK